MATLQIIPIPGKIYEIVRGPNPHKNGEKEKVTITIIVKDRHDAFPHDFYYFHGNGTPDPQYHERASHSNMFIAWGVEDVKEIGQAKFATKVFKNFQWTITGIPKIDTDMAQLDARCAVFDAYAPAWAKRKFLRQEDKNFHTENSQMVDRFADWVSAGNKPEEFPKSSKKSK